MIFKKHILLVAALTFFGIFSASQANSALGEPFVVVEKFLVIQQKSTIRNRISSFAIRKSDSKSTSSIWMVMLSFEQTYGNGKNGFILLPIIDTEKLIRVCTSLKDSRKLSISSKAKTYQQIYDINSIMDLKYVKNESSEIVYLTGRDKNIDPTIVDAIKDLKSTYNQLEVEIELDIQDLDNFIQITQQTLNYIKSNSQ